MAPGDTVKPSSTMPTNSSTQKGGRGANAAAAAAAATSSSGGAGAGAGSATAAAASPPTAQSKRDKKRQALAEKLAAVSEQFNHDRDRTYREELQKIQIDYNLISRIDLHQQRPLEEIQRQYRELSQASANTGGSDRPNRTLLEMAGPTLQEFMSTVEDLVETRDAELAAHKAEYERKMRHHNNTLAYEVELARREHKALSSTLRDRLINSITSKKYRLNKEKEALDISESSAHLLHPNQFSLAHPASPGGTHSKRTTRLRREAEEMPGFAGMDNSTGSNKKRKRNNGNGSGNGNGNGNGNENGTGNVGNGNANGDEDGSPAPHRRGDHSNSTPPLWRSDSLSKNGQGAKDSDTVYQINNLFTDRELTMVYNQAALASYKHLLRRDANGNVISSPDDSDAGNGDADDDKNNDLAAPPMERHPSHSTRSTRGGQTNHNYYDDKVMGIEGLANFELPGNLDKIGGQEPKLPPLYQSYSKPYTKNDSNTPAPLAPDDVNNDFAIMNVFKRYARDHGLGSNLEAANGGRSLIEKITTPNNYVAFVQGPRPSVDGLAESLGVQTNGLHEDTAMGGVTSTNSNPVPAAGGNRAASIPPPMSRQSSFSGTAMSRSGSGTGASRGRRRGGAGG